MKDYVRWGWEKSHSEDKYTLKMKMIATPEFELLDL